MRASSAKWACGQVALAASFLLGLLAPAAAQDAYADQYGAGAAGSPATSGYADQYSGQSGNGGAAGNYADQYSGRPFEAVPSRDPTAGGLPGHSGDATPGVPDLLSPVPGLGGPNGQTGSTALSGSGPGDQFGSRGYGGGKTSSPADPFGGGHSGGPGQGPHYADQFGPEPNPRNGPARSLQNRAGDPDPFDMTGAGATGDGL